jgi:hypothetical protein
MDNCVNNCVEIALNLIDCVATKKLAANASVHEEYE